MELTTHEGDAIAGIEPFQSFSPPPSAEPRELKKRIRRVGAALTGDRRYGHYLRIPERICRSLDLFRVRYHRAATRRKLRCYYLFIGVVDDGMDLIDSSNGLKVLRRLQTLAPMWDVEATRDRCAAVTELLKAQLEPSIATRMARRLRTLHAAVMAERQAPSLREFVRSRRLVGRLTADLSYLMIEPCLEQPNSSVRNFLRRVGAVGCLIDSVVDARADFESGHQRLPPRFWGRFLLTLCAVRWGLPLIAAHPRAAGLFLQAAIDTLLDRRVRSDCRAAV